MSKQEIITHERVEQELSKIEEATLEEELERKRRGLTQEPASARVKREVSPKSGAIDEPANELSRRLADRFGGDVATSEKKIDHGTLEDNIAEWLAENPNYEFENIDPEISVHYDNGAPQLPTKFLDFLVGRGKMRIQDNFLFSKVNRIRVYNGGAGKILIALQDKDDDVILHLFFNPYRPFVCVDYFGKK